MYLDCAALYSQRADMAANWMQYFSLEKRVRLRTGTWEDHKGTEDDGRHSMTEISPFPYIIMDVVQPGTLSIQCSDARHL